MTTVAHYNYGGHPSQLAGAHEPNPVGAQLASLSTESGRDTTGTLGEEATATWRNSCALAA